MLKEYTCIICPNGCEIEAQIEGDAIVDLEGALCPKGRTYVEQEITNPQRNIASSVLVKNGALPLASVRLTKPIPKGKIFEAMEQIKKVSVEAPTEPGQIVIKNLLGLDSDVIITKRVLKAIP